VCGAVTKLLDFNETRHNPKAIAAVREEVEALAACGTWDQHPYERDEIVQWAQQNNITVHIGEGLGICSIKNSEMQEALQRWKGRFCFRTPTARDEGGALAIFQEMSSRPTTIVGMNVSVAYGAIRGNKTTVADAVKAYVQSDLKSLNPTYIEIPRYLLPPKWRHMRRPVCRLIKALYGHPEAGAHWERHLKKIIVKMGGKAMPSHPSCFFFKGRGLLLVVYVDDLMLSGPEGAHEEFWKELAIDVHIEPPEELHRYLGRHHTFETVDRLPYDLLTHFDSATKA
jgi:hypothetical protein